MSFETDGAPTAASPTADQLEANAAAAAEGSVDANAAASSPADETDANQPANLLDVVKSAVAPEADAGAGSSTVEAEGTEAEAGKTEGDPDKGELTAEQQAEADAKLPFHEHPRWKQVIAERDGFKEDAGRFREIEGFMQQHGLLPDEVSEGFAVMAALKSGTPEGLKEARDYFASRLTLLDASLGNVLPDDLRQRVDGGELSEEAAQELAQARAAEKLRKDAADAEEQKTTEQRERNATTARATAMATAVQDWEDQQRGTDPDYAKKADLVEARCLAIVRRTGKPPATPEEARKLCEDALKEVNDSLKSFVPTPKQISRQPVGSSAVAKAEPKTLREAVVAGLEKAQ